MAIEHSFEVTPTTLRGTDSGRVRYRVVCTTCHVVVHPATTGPEHMQRAHMEGRASYEEEPLTTSTVEFPRRRNER